MSESLTVGINKVITMQYSLCNTDGIVVRAASGAPVTYLHGAGVLFEKLERALENHAVGEIITVRLLPDDAFGKRDTELVCKVPLDEFPPGETIEIGGRVTGTDKDSGEITFTVTDIVDNVAHLDGNHPLAGQSLVFEVEIQAIRAASDDEIRQAKVLA